MILVKNINGYNPCLCCKTWKQHWEECNESGRPWPDKCKANGCDNSADVGAHVLILDPHPGDKSYWIVPFCRGCNNKKGQEVKVHSNTVFAWANKKAHN